MSHLPERRRRGTRATAGMVATALDDPRGLNRKKKVKGKVNLVSGKVSKKGSKGGAAVVSVDGETQPLPPPVATRSSTW